MNEILGKEGSIIRALVHFWDETRLRNTSSTVIDAWESGHRQIYAQEDLRRNLPRVLGLGCGLRSETVISKGAEVRSARTTPSAGALFPYEIYATLPGDCLMARAGGTYFYDVDGRSLRPFVSRGIKAAAAAAGLEDPLRARALGMLTIVARPWLSMRKYGNRGYLYACLDVAHAAAGISWAARAAGLAPVVCLRFRRCALAETLTLHDACREPQILVVLTEAGSPDPMDGSGIRYEPERYVLEPPGDFEEQAWRATRPVSAFEENFPPPQHVASVTSLAGWKASTSRRHASPDRTSETLADCSHIVRHRVSARGFLPAPLSTCLLEAALADLDQTIRTDCADEGAPGISLSLVASRVEGLDPAVYRIRSAAQLEPVSMQAGDPLDAALTRACMNQSVVGRAAGLVILHAPIRSLLERRGRTGLAELHFHAGHVAHKLCLAGSRHGFGITCIGGFDGQLLSRMIDLEEREDILYVLAFGVADPVATKLDRAVIPFAHGAASDAGISAWPVDSIQDQTS